MAVAHGLGVRFSARHVSSYLAFIAGATFKERAGGWGVTVSVPVFIVPARITVCNGQTVL